MKRYLDFFEPADPGALEKSLGRAFDAGGRKAIVIGTETFGQKMADALRYTGFSWVESTVESFKQSDDPGADIVLVAGGGSADVSLALHACIDKNVAVIAPVTEDHCSKRTVFLLSIPKAGTHMLIRLFDLMGLTRSPDRSPQPGTWATPVGYEYHAPCRDLLGNDWFDPGGRQLFFRSPAIFVYRNPLDIVVSELDWFVRPEHAFSGYLNCFEDKDEQLDRLIADSTVMGTIRDRINRYAGWMNFENVIPVSYEELVGGRGGGSDAEQLDAIWAMQLKLHIPGNPQEYGTRLYDSASATFSKGKIGRHVDFFNNCHFKTFDSLPQDFMQSLGYVRGSLTSSKVKMLRRRTLVIKEMTPDVLYKPRLVRENFLGWNIIEVAGKYYPIRQGEHVMSPQDAQVVAAGQKGFMVLQDAVDAVTYNEAVTTPVLKDGGTELVVEGYLGFNVVRHGGLWYGFSQATGPIDIGGLAESAMETMKRNGECVTGRNSADVKTEILRLAIQLLEQRNAELAARLKAAETVVPVDRDSVAEKQ